MNGNVRDDGPDTAKIGPVASGSASARALPLVVDHLRYALEGRQLVDDVGFQIGDGGIVVVLGPNGAGKSLLLRLCHGLLVPDDGAVRWRDDGTAQEGRRAHAMVFQKPVMLRRSARANVIHALRACGASRPEASRSADKELARFGLTELAHRPARVLSGGEQQRLAIARACALRPEMLFLDEPTAHLDPGATRQVEAMLLALKADGITLMLATHDLPQARRLADRVLFLDRGRLLDDRPAASFFAGEGSVAGRAFLTGDLLW